MAVTLVSELLTRIAYETQEMNSAGAPDINFPSGLWSQTEVINYISDIQREFILKSQILKQIGAVASVTGQRIYSNPADMMQMDRIAFSNVALNRTTKFSLDRSDPKWRTLAGIPKQYHQDQLPIKEFEVDRAPNSSQTGLGYTATGLYGTLRYAISGTRVTDGAITAADATFTSATAAFTAADVGKTIYVVGAGTGGSGLVTTIASINSATSVELTAVAVVTVSGAVAAWGTPYGATGTYGLLRYWYGTRPINGILTSQRPHAGTLRQMLAGLTNFEVLGSRLVGTVTDASDELTVPSYALAYIKYGTMGLMFAKEGEAQDMVRSKYCNARYERGIGLFRRVMGVVTKDKLEAMVRK